MNVPAVCPNGHRFQVDDRQLGEPVRCPYEGCGAEFVLRQADEASAADSWKGDGAAAQLPYALIPRGRVQKSVAIASLAFGIVGLVIVVCFPLGVVGLVLGIDALGKANREPARYGGRWLAVGGICTGGLSLLVGPLVTGGIVMTYLAVREARDTIGRFSCELDLMTIGHVMRTYAKDNDGQFPPDLEAVIGTAAGQVSFEPDTKLSDLQSRYVYITAQATSDDPANVLVYEKRDCRGGGGHVLFVDGQVDFIEPYSTVEELVEQTRQRLMGRKTDRK